MAHGHAMSSLSPLFPQYIDSKEGRDFPDHVHTVSHYVMGRKMFSLQCIHPMHSSLIFIYYPQIKEDGIKWIHLHHSEIEISFWKTLEYEIVSQPALK